MYWQSFSLAGAAYYWKYTSHLIWIVAWVVTCDGLVFCFTNSKHLLLFVYDSGKPGLRNTIFKYVIQTYVINYYFGINDARIRTLVGPYVFNYTCMYLNQVKFEHLIPTLFDASIRGNIFILIKCLPKKDIIQ